MAATKKISDHFEKSLTKLNDLVEKMENDQLSLEDSLKYFEEGIALIQQCQKTLTHAEQKIRILTEKNGKLIIENAKSD